MNKAFYPIFKYKKRPQYFLLKEEVPRYIKIWAYNDYTKRHSGELSEIITGTNLILEDSLSRKLNILEFNGDTQQDTSILPNEYQQVEYIESNGTQYIDTDISDEGQWHLKIKCTLLLNATQIILGKSSGAGWWFGITPLSYTGGLYGSGVDNTVDILGTELVNCIINTTNQYIDGTVNNKILPRRNTSTDYSTNTYSLFGVSTFLSNCRLYKAEFYKNNQLIANFIPCYRKSDNEIGLYDLVSNTFFTNQGTGTFLKGSDVTSLPTPEFEIPIKNVTGQANIKIQNKNLAWTGWAEDFVTRINNEYAGNLIVRDNRDCLYYSPNAGYGDYNNKYIFKIDFKENTQYAFQFDILKTGSASRTFAIYYTDGTYTTITNLNNINVWEHKTLISQPNKTVKYATAFYTDGGSYIDIDTFQVEESSTATSYVEHKEQNYPLTLGDIELNKIDTAQDYFYKENNKWYLHKEIMKRTITNVSSVGTASSGIKFAWIGSIPNVLSNSFILCSKYINSSDATKNNSIRFVTSNLYVYDNRFTDIETAQSLLNGLEYYHIMATPTDTEITDTTLINQLEATLQAKTYKDITYVKATSSELQPILDIQYWKKKTE